MSEEQPEEFTLEERIEFLEGQVEGLLNICSTLLLFVVSKPPSLTVSNIGSIISALSGTKAQIATTPITRTFHQQGVVSSHNEVSNGLTELIDKTERPVKT